MPTPRTPADPLVVCIEDMGAHGMNAEVYGLAQAIDLAADFEQGDHPWRITDVRYLDGENIGEKVPNIDALVQWELKEREDDAAEKVALQRDYYAGLGVRTGRPW